MHPTATACGKVIVLGEHSVVHGYPALAAGLPEALRLDVTELASNAPLELRIPSWDLDLTLGEHVDHPVARAAWRVLRSCEGPMRGYRIEGTTVLPSRAGLGSSAALTVALARLVLGNDAPTARVVEASLEGERVFHGEPSGVDSVVAARGGVLRFVRGQDPVAVAMPEPLGFVVIPSGIPRQTAEQVAKVRHALEQSPRIARPILDALGAAVDEGIDAISRRDLNGLGVIMSMAHELLSAFGVSSWALDDLCARARRAGALGAKLTGAGGGGCVVALVSGDGAPVRSALSERHPFFVQVG